MNVGAQSRNAEFRYEGLTSKEKILRAAATLPETFTAEDLVVAAWKLHPETFGMVGYRLQYPSSQRVWSKVHGSTGLIADGLLAVVETKVFRLTNAGRQAANSERVSA